MFYSFNGLGALPGFPPSSLLKPGYVWIRYLSAAGIQVTGCPPEGRYGCLLYGGHAWGQKLAQAGDEFLVQYVKPVAPSAAELRERAKQECTQTWTAWAKNTPQRAACISDANFKKLIEMCVDYKTGKRKDYPAQSWITYLCHRKECRQELEAWRKAHPRKDRCLTDADRSKITDWCMRVKSGELTKDQYLDRIDALVKARCPKPKPTPTPAPTPSGGGGAAPTPTDVLPAGGPVHDEGAGGPVEASGLLRQLGPVVGIGLLVALGLTVASQSKGKKGRRR